MEQLKNVTITKVYEGKSGGSGKKAWTAYNIYIDGDDRKFGMFKRPNTPTPEEGMVFSAECHTAQRGEYTNYDLKKIVFKDEQTTSSSSSGYSSVPRNTKDNFPVSMAVSYCKDTFGEKYREYYEKSPMLAIIRLSRDARALKGFVEMDKEDFDLAFGSLNNTTVGKGKPEPPPPEPDPEDDGPDDDDQAYPEDDDDEFPPDD